MKMAVRNTEAVKNISNLKNTPNLQKSTFGMHSPPRKHPKSRIRAIWDTFVLLKTPQIFNSKHLGCNQKQFELFMILQGFKNI